VLRLMTDREEIIPSAAKRGREMELESITGLEGWRKAGKSMTRLGSIKKNS